MFRVTHNLLTDLALWMTAFGGLVGLLFPAIIGHFMSQTPIEVSFGFRLAAVFSGILVGYVGFLIARQIISPRLRMLSSRMQRVGIALAADDPQQALDCNPKQCVVTVDSDDDIGQCADAFNRMIATLFQQRQMEDKARIFSHQVATRLDLSDLSAHALAFLLEHTPAVAGGLFLNRRGTLEVVAEIGLISAEQIAANPLLQRAILQASTQRVELPADIEADGILARYRPRDVLAVPIGDGGEPLAALLLAAERGFDEFELSLLDTLTTVLGLALNNALAHDELERLAALDGLTGLYNRRFGLARLEEEYSRSRREQIPLGLLIFDIDHFKRVNDTLGHLAGDQMLRHIAALLKREIRDTDVGIRYGGEEFLVVCPNTDLAAAGHLAERLRKKIRETACDCGAQGEQHVTISCGIAAFPECPINDINDLVHWADEALYAAKAQGRDRIIHASVGQPKPGAGLRTGETP